MQFHISAHHTPDNCGVHRLPDNPDGSPVATVTDWPGRCKEVGVKFIKGGVCHPSHLHFMFVETDDYEKLRVLMQPVMGYWDIVISAVTDL